MFFQGVIHYKQQSQIVRPGCASKSIFVIIQFALKPLIIKLVQDFIRYHNLRHPAEIGAPEVERFLSHLAVDLNVSASTQNQALAALLFLYKHVLAIDLPWLNDVVHVKRPERLPVVLSREETQQLLACFEGELALVTGLLYGSGLRLIEWKRCVCGSKNANFARGLLVQHG